MHHSSRSGFKGKGPWFVLVVLGLLFGLSALVWLLWNAILPKVTTVQPLNYWQAMGLLVLSRILFGRFRLFRSPSHRSHPKKHWKEKWMKMSDEERAQFKEKWKKRCDERKDQQKK